MCATLANFGKHAGKEFNTQNKDFMNIRISIILPVCLPIHIVQKKNYILTLTEKTAQEIKFIT